MSVYLIGAEGTTLVKVGFTSGDVEHRLSTLQVGSPVPLILWGAWVSLQERHEKALHRWLSDRRVHGEWFDLGGPIGVALFRLLDDCPGKWAASGAEVLALHEALCRYSVDHDGAWSYAVGRWEA